MFAVVMSLPRVDVRSLIKKSVQVIRLKALEFKPANVTQMSRRGAGQRGGRHRVLCGSRQANSYKFVMFLAVWHNHEHYEQPSYRMPENEKYISEVPVGRVKLKPTHHDRFDR